MVLLVRGTTWAASFGLLASRELERCFGAYPVDSSRFWVPPEFWDADDLALEMTDTPNIWTDGSREDYPVGGFEVAGAGVSLPAPEEAMCGDVWGVAGEYGDARLERCRAFMLSQALCSPSSVLNFGEQLLLLCRHTGLVIWVLITSMLPGLVVDCWIMAVWLSLFLWSRMEI